MPRFAFEGYVIEAEAGLQARRNTNFGAGVRLLGLGICLRCFLLWEMEELFSWWFAC